MAASYWWLHARVFGLLALSVQSSWFPRCLSCLFNTELVPQDTDYHTVNNNEKEPKCIMYTHHNEKITEITPKIMTTTKRSNIKIVLKMPTATVEWILKQCQQMSTTTMEAILK